MGGKRQFLFATGFLCISLLIIMRPTIAEQVQDSDAIVNNIYDSILQREYAGPVLFPNHQVERKAQRSPSLRLRFGRRSDPNLILLPRAEKRWWGDVHQKPIRSPSLRLRFGKRDGLTAPIDNMDLGEKLDYGGGSYVDEFERPARKPQRLRWGRSAGPLEDTENELTELAENEAIVEQRQRAAELLNRLLMQDKILKSLFEALNYNYPPSVRTVTNALSSTEVDGDGELKDMTDFDSDFQREARKSGPLRLRWGRSINSVSSADVPTTMEPKLSEKKNPTSYANAAIDHVPNKN